jgi:hypothetical protein
METRSNFARLMDALAVLGAASWLCIYPVALVIAGIALLVLVPEGNELLDATAVSDRVGVKFIFYSSLVAWALGAWYCSRVLLMRRFAGRFGSGPLDSDDAFTIFVRTWLPRALGGFIYVALAGYFFSAGEKTDGSLVLACAIAYWLFVVYRRAILPSIAPAAMRKEELDWTTQFVLALSLGLSFALLAALLVSPVTLPRSLGAAPIILLAFTAWTLFGSIVLVLLPKSYGLPSLALLPLALALAAGGVDNHEPRQLPPDPGIERAASIEAAALAWLGLHEAEFRLARRRGDEWFPVYVAAAEGGGLRAAYWTGSVFGELQHATDGRFAGRLFAISSVSGGSLGAAAFAAEVASRTPCTSAAGASVRNCVRDFLNEDYLSPVTAYLLFPDMLQRFLPFTPIRRFDRARALELSWEQSWADVHPGSNANAFARSYEVLAAAPGPLPYLFLNGTRVETGKRVLVSPARFDQDEMAEVDDLFAVSGRHWSVPLSTAVGLSARFTYVTPAAKICIDAAQTCDSSSVWGHVVDGGYHENSGAQTAEGLLRALARAARAFEATQPAGRTRVLPQAIVVTNDAGSLRLCDPQPAAQPSRWFTELLSPVAALWNSRVARGSQARRALADAAAGAERDPLGKDCAGDRMRANTLEFSLASAQHAEKPPALGWFLSVGSTRRMDQALCRDDHVAAIALVRRDLGVTTPYSCAVAPFQ